MPANHETHETRGTGHGNRSRAPWSWADCGHSSSPARRRGHIRRGSLRLLGAALLAGFPLHGLASLKVVATTPDLGALAREVGGDLVEVTTLAKATEDPHFVDAKPSFLMKLNRADALIEGGAELESAWLASLLEGARNARLAPGAPGRILGNQGIQMLDVPATLDRAKGDIHAAGNPHYLTDPANARIVAGHLAEAFARLDPPSADLYRANLKRFTDRLDALLVEWQKRMEPFRGRPVAAYHDSWPYFARRFGLKIDLFLEPKPGLPPTPAHLADVMSRMKQANACVILVEPYLDRRTAETVARQTGATVVDAAYLPGGVKGTDDRYLNWLDHLVTSIAKAFEAGGP